MRSENTQDTWQRRLLRDADIEGRVRVAGLGDDVGTEAVLLNALLWLTGLRARGEANANCLVRRDVAMACHSLPPAFDGFRLLHLSDLHFHDGPGYLSALCKTVRQCPVDLCVMTGDYRFAKRGGDDVLRRGLAQLLDALDAPHGTLAVLGNSDRGRFVELFADLGVRMLVNEHVAIERSGQCLYIAGIDDPHDYRCDDIPAALSGIPNDGFTLLLAHSPECVAEAAAAGVNVYLCGHTHGGQICLPGGYAPKRNTRCTSAYFHGAWQHAGMQGYTSAGLGTVTVPVRFNSPPEAVVVTLRRV